MDLTHLTPGLERAPFGPEENILEVQLDVILNARHGGETGCRLKIKAGDTERDRDQLSRRSRVFFVVVLFLSLSHFLPIFSIIQLLHIHRKVGKADLRFKDFKDITDKHGFFWGWEREREFCNMYLKHAS